MRRPKNWPQVHSRRKKASPRHVVGMKDSPTSDKRQGHAIALQHAAAVLTRMANKPNRLMSLGLESARTRESTEAAALGCLFAARILCPLIVELALKALIDRTNDDDAPRTHDLSDLFEQLSLDIQETISQEFDRIKREHYYLEDERTLKQVFLDHRLEFVGWRYLDRPDDLAGIRLETFNYAICAILNIYEDKANGGSV